MLTKTDRTRYKVIEKQTKEERCRHRERHRGKFLQTDTQIYRGRQQTDGARGRDKVSQRYTERTREGERERGS